MDKMNELNKMERIAENIQVFVASYFGKQRPFEMIKSKLPNTPKFPNRIEYRALAPGGSAWDKDTIKSSVESPVQSEGGMPLEVKPLFVEGSDFRTGTYYGDIYRVLGSDGTEKHYYLFRITREPSKIIRIDPAELHAPQEIIKLLVDSPGSRVSKIYMQRTGTPEGDMELISGKLKSLQATMADLNDLVTEGLEVFVRAYYLKHKLNSLANNGKQKGHNSGRKSRKMIPGTIYGRIQ